MKILLVCALAVVTGLHGNSQNIFLRQAHSHNDYLHKHPLHDALSLGFLSIEADVYARGGELIVSHLPPFLFRKRFSRLYIQPLKDWLLNGGADSLTASGNTLTVMVDFKTRPEETLPILIREAAPLLPWLEKTEDGHVTDGCVRLLISGSRPTATSLEKEFSRIVCLDGNPGDLDANHPKSLMPRISASWGSVMSWNGKGQITETEQARLDSLGAACRAQGKEFRLWSCPQTRAAWQALYHAGPNVLLNADNLDEAAAFLHGQIPGLNRGK